MININEIKRNGEINYADEFTFRYEETQNGYSVCITITTIKLGNKPLILKIKPDINHMMPHIHFGDHIASFAIDNGMCIAGECSAAIKNRIGSWIRSHRSDLMVLWNDLKKGKPYEEARARVRERWEENGVFFIGEKPEHERAIEYAHIWYNGTLGITRMDDGKQLVTCSKDMCILLTKGYVEGSLVFKSSSNKDIQIHTEQ